MKGGKGGYGGYFKSFIVSFWYTEVIAPLRTDYHEYHLIPSPATLSLPRFLSFATTCALSGGASGVLKPLLRSASSCSKHRAAAR